jgi:hypothetical protein
MSAALGRTVAIWICGRHPSICHHWAIQRANLKELQALLQSSPAIFQYRTNFTLAEEAFHFVALLLGLDKGMDFVKDSDAVVNESKFYQHKKSTL